MSLWLEREAMRGGGADGPIVGVHKGHQWHVDGETYSRLDIEGCPVQACFGDGTASKAYGPFKSFSAVDGVAYGEGFVFASIESASGLWYSHDSGRRWPTLAVEASDA